MTVLSRRNLMIGAGIAVLGAAAAGVLLTREAEATIAIGAPAPAFTTVDANGAARSLAEFAGRIVVLEWTNHDCPYVRKHYDSGNMQATQRDAMQNGVVWLSIISSAPGEQGFLNGPQALEVAASRNAAPTAILLDPSGVVGHAYDARTTPHMFIINPAGRVVYQGAIDDRPRASPSSLVGATNYVRAALADIGAGRPVAVAQTTPYGCSVKYRG